MEIVGGVYNLLSVSRKVKLLMILKRLHQLHVLGNTPMNASRLQTRIFSALLAEKQLLHIKSVKHENGKIRFLSREN